MSLHQDMLQYLDFTELLRFALKYIKVLTSLNAERRQRSAQPLKFFEAQRAREVQETNALKMALGMVCGCIDSITHLLKVDLILCAPRQ